MFLHNKTFVLIFSWYLLTGLNIKESESKGSIIELKVKKKYADNSNASVNNAKIAFRKLHAEEKVMLFKL